MSDFFGNIAALCLPCFRLEGFLTVSQSFLPGNPKMYIYINKTFARIDMVNICMYTPIYMYVQPDETIQIHFYIKPQSCQILMYAQLTRV